MEKGEAKKMKYDEYFQNGSISKSITYEGTPQEIHDLIKLQEDRSKIDCSKLTINVNGSDVAAKVKKEIDKAFNELIEKYRYQSSK